MENQEQEAKINQHQHNFAVQHVMHGKSTEPCGSFRVTFHAGSWESARQAIDIVAKHTGYLPHRLILSPVDPTSVDHSPPPLSEGEVAATMRAQPGRNGGRTWLHKRHVPVIDETSEKVIGWEEREQSIEAAAWQKSPTSDEKVLVLDFFRGCNSTISTGAGMLTGGLVRLTGHLYLSPLVDRAESISLTAYKRDSESGEVDFEDDPKVGKAVLLTREPIFEGEHRSGKRWVAGRRLVMINKDKEEGRKIVMKHGAQRSFDCPRCKTTLALKKVPLNVVCPVCDRLIVGN